MQMLCSVLSSPEKVLLNLSMPLCAKGSWLFPERLKPPMSSLEIQDGWSFLRQGATGLLDKCLLQFPRMTKMVVLCFPLSL